MTCKQTITNLGVVCATLGAVLSLTEAISALIYGNSEHLCTQAAYNWVHWIAVHTSIELAIVVLYACKCSAMRNFRAERVMFQVLVLSIACGVATLTVFVGDCFVGDFANPPSDAHVSMVIYASTCILCALCVCCAAGVQKWTISANDTQLYYTDLRYDPESP